MRPETLNRTRKKTEVIVDSELEGEEEDFQKDSLACTEAAKSTANGTREETDAEEDYEAPL